MLDCCGLLSGDGPKRFFLAQAGRLLHARTRHAAVTDRGDNPATRNFFHLTMPLDSKAVLRRRQALVLSVATAASVLLAMP